MGSEMCIRDRFMDALPRRDLDAALDEAPGQGTWYDETYSDLSPLQDDRDAINAAADRAVAAAEAELRTRDEVLESYVQAALDDGAPEAKEDPLSSPSTEPGPTTELPRDDAVLGLPPGLRSGDARTRWRPGRGARSPRRAPTTRRRPARRKRRPSRPSTPRSVCCGRSRRTGRACRRTRLLIYRRRSGSRPPPRRRRTAWMMCCGASRSSRRRCASGPRATRRRTRRTTRCGTSCATSEILPFPLFAPRRVMEIC